MWIPAVDRWPLNSLIYWREVPVTVIEIESKFKSPGNEKVEKNLARIGAKKISEGMVEDIYFSHPA